MPNPDGNVFWGLQLWVNLPAAQRAARFEQFQQPFLDFGETFLIETIVARRETVEHIGMLGQPAPAK